nr:hypothetical protein [uncultured Carboxylicivirga sp.]
MKTVTHPSILSFPDSTWQYIDKCFQKDLFIRTKSGLEWSLCDEPPEKPGWFILKALSKKGRNKPDVKKRLEYHQLVSEINTGDSAYSVFYNSVATDSSTMKVYNIQVVYNIDSNGNKFLEKYYQIKE